MQFFSGVTLFDRLASKTLADTREMRKVVVVMAVINSQNKPFKPFSKQWTRQRIRKLLPHFLNKP